MNGQLIHAHSAAAVLNGALGPHSARVVPSAAAHVVLRDDVRPAAATAALHRADPPLQLATCPVMILHRDELILVCPGGGINVTTLVRGNPTLDVRIDTEIGRPARVVISWIDGREREIVAERLDALPDTGLRVELVRESLASSSATW